MANVMRTASFCLILSASLLPVTVTSAKPPESVLAGDVIADSPDFSISGSGVTVATLTNGATAFSNRGYVWERVPASLNGRHYTQTAGGSPPHLVVHVKRDAVLEVITAIDQPGAKLPGWDHPGTSFTYSDGKLTRVVLLRKRLHAGQELEIPQGNWSGVMVLLSE